MIRYEVRDATTGEVLHRNWTARGALDTWRLRYRGRPVQLVKVRSSGEESPVVEGLWHRGRGRSADPAEEALPQSEAEALPPSEALPKSSEPVEDGRLREIFDLVVGTSAADWYAVAGTDVPYPGPVDAPRFGATSSPPAASPARSAVLRSDPRIVLAWGWRRSGAGEPGTPAPPGAHTVERTAEIRYSGATVHRGRFLDVDRGTVYLPVPSSGTAPQSLQVRRWDSQLIALINELAGLDQYDSYCSRLGLVPVPGHPLDRGT